MSPRDVLRAFAECDGPATLVTVVEARGSTPCAVGDRMLVGPEGWRAGSVGGGRLEAKALGLCAESADRMQLVTWNLQTDVGMTCGGAVTLLVERTTAPWQVVVYGAGHVAQALVRVLLTLDCRITVCDPRPEWTSQLPADARLRVVEAYDPAACPPGASVVLMTQGHRTDLPVLHALLDPLGGVGPAEFPLGALIARIQREGVREVILATPPTVEGEATSLYLAEALRSDSPRTSGARRVRLALIAGLIVLELLHLLLLLLLLMHGK